MHIFIYYNIPYLGCEAEIKQIQPLALYVHCRDHVSQLIAYKAVNESNILRNSLNTVQDLGSLYNQPGLNNYFKIMKIML